MRKDRRYALGAIIGVGTSAERRFRAPASTFFPWRWILAASVAPGTWKLVRADATVAAGREATVVVERVP